MEDNFVNENFYEISLDIIDINRILFNYFNSKYGSVVFFVGKVRSVNNSKKVIGVNYDMCDELVLKTLYDICNYYNSSKQFKIYVSHFKGYLRIGEISVVIIVESFNRKDSFFICNSILEDIKNKLPIWKYEYYDNGFSDWLNGKKINIRNN